MSVIKQTNKLSIQKMHLNSEDQQCVCVCVCVFVYMCVYVCVCVCVCVNHVSVHSNLNKICICTF
jgi:hypothetical protein